MDEVVRQVLENELGLKIGRRIGCGGFSEVYEAQSAEGVSCAVKVSLAQVDEPNRGIAKELENLNLVNAVNGHPHVVQFMGAWLVGGYLVTRWELAREGSLHDLLRHYQDEGKKGIPIEELIKYLWDAAEGIDFLNGLGIYHRDIKPQNLLLFYGQVKIADLGLAKFAGASTVSHTGSGTLGYLPPEAYDQHRLEKTVDLYSLAATYVKLRTGREPFGENPHEIVQRQTRGDPVLDGLRPDEAELVRQALATRPEHRPQGGAKAWVRALYKVHWEPASAKKTNGKTESQVNGSASPPASSKELVVGPQGDVGTLEEALAQCEDGATITLARGNHCLDRPLEITKSIRLVGAGMDETRVLCEGEGCVLRFAGAGTFEVEEISFEHFGGKPANVVEISSGRVMMTGCRFRGGVNEDDSSSNGTGLLVCGTAEVEVKACQPIQNQRCGMLIFDHAAAKLEGNLCQNNKGGGICWAGWAAGIAYQNVCRGNGVNGIIVTGSVAPVLEGNTCESNEGNGISYWENASGTARNNLCRNNRKHGIYVGGSAAPILEGNTCESNKWSGILYADNALGAARKNVCRTNGGNGIELQGSAAPILEGNTCDKNKGCGITYGENASGTARNNVCRTNRGSGIDVQGSAAPILEGNTCDKNKGRGIIYGENASGTARNNFCCLNKLGAIHVDDGAAPILENNHQFEWKHVKLWVVVAVALGVWIWSLVGLVAIITGR